MIIPDPVAYPEEQVLVLNYRKRPATWEIGELRAFSFAPAYLASRQDGSKFEVKCSWRYEIHVRRPAENLGRGRSIHYTLTVGSDGIRPAR